MAPAESPSSPSCCRALICRQPGRGLGPCSPPINLQCGTTSPLPAQSPLTTVHRSCSMLGSSPGHTQACRVCLLPTSPTGLWLKIRVPAAGSTRLSVLTHAFAPTAPCAWNLCPPPVLLQFPARMSPLPRAFPDQLGPHHSWRELPALPAWTVVPPPAGPCHPISLLICLLARESPRAGSALCWGGLAPRKGSRDVRCICQGLKMDLERDGPCSPRPRPGCPRLAHRQLQGPQAKAPGSGRQPSCVLSKNADCNILLALSSGLWEEAARGNGGGRGLWVGAWAPLGQDGR